MVFKGVGERLEREQRQLAWLAWHVGALTKWDPKKFPKLEDLTGVKSKPKVQSPEEMRAVFAGIREAARKRAERGK